MHGCDPAKIVAKDKTSQAKSVKLTDFQSMSELQNSTTLQTGRETPAWQVGSWQLTKGHGDLHSTWAEGGRSKRLIR